MKDRVKRSRGMETLITEVLSKVNPTNHFRLVKKEV
jgi:hypothetical protein